MFNHKNLKIRDVFYMVLLPCNIDSDVIEVTVSGIIVPTVYGKWPIEYSFDKETLYYLEERLDDGSISEYDVVTDSFFKQTDERMCFHEKQDSLKFF